MTLNAGGLKSKMRRSFYWVFFCGEIYESLTLASTTAKQGQAMHFSDEVIIMHNIYYT